MTEWTARIALLCIAIALSGTWAQDWEGETRLPEAVSRAVQKAFPGASILEVEREREDGMDLFEIEAAAKGRRVELEVSADGTIASVESSVKASELSEGDLKHIRRASGGGRVSRVVREEIRSVPVAGKLTPLATPQVIYEINYKDKRGRSREVNMRSGDGKVIRDDDDDDWDDDDDDDDRHHRRGGRDDDDDRDDRDSDDDDDRHHRRDGDRDGDERREREGDRERGRGRRERDGDRESDGEREGDRRGREREGEREGDREGGGREREGDREREGGHKSREREGGHKSREREE